MRFLQKRKINGKLTLDAIKKSEAFMFNLPRREAFECDVKEELHTNLAIKTGLNANQLTPFLDSNGILRPQGRLSKSSLEFETKKP